MNEQEIKELRDSLEIGPTDIVTGAVLVVSIQDFDKAEDGILIATTAETDWIKQIGLIRAAELIATERIKKTDSEG